MAQINPNEHAPTLKPSGWPNCEETLIKMSLFTSAPTKQRWRIPQTRKKHRPQRGRNFGGMKHELTQDRPIDMLDYRVLKAPQARHVSNRRWSASTASAEPAVKCPPHSPSPAGAEHSAPAGLESGRTLPPVPLARLAPPTVTNMTRLRRFQNPISQHIYPVQF